MRFRLKTDFLTYARDQIRGGLWYKVRAPRRPLACIVQKFNASTSYFFVLQPAWWDAVSKVPPVHFQPRIQKREVPTIRFVEDSLMRCVRVGAVNVHAHFYLIAGCSPCHHPFVITCSEFKRKNPTIAQFDTPAADAADRRTVAQMFVDRQLAAMKGKDVSKRQAYAVAQQWMLENGKDLFERLSVPEHVKDAIKKDPKDIVAARQAMESVMKQQLAAVRSALRERGATGAGAGAGAAASSGAVSGAARRKLVLPEYRSFRPALDDARVSLRAGSPELVLPRGAAFDAAEAAAGPSSASSASAAASDESSGSASKKSRDILAEGSEAAVAQAIASGGAGAEASKEGAGKAAGGKQQTGGKAQAGGKGGASQQAQKGGAADTKPKQ